MIKDGEFFMIKEYYIKGWTHKHLLHWNTRPLFPISKWKVTYVPESSMISYNDPNYSVPYRYKGMEVRLKEALNHHLEIYFNLECIATHPIISGINKSFTTFKSPYY